MKSLPLWSYEYKDGRMACSLNKAETWAGKSFSRCHWANLAKPGIDAREQGAQDQKASPPPDPREVKGTLGDIWSGFKAGVVGCL